MGLFARLTEAVGGGLCYHNDCCQGLNVSLGSRCFVRVSVVAVTIQTEL
jgi:hypothetical protein